LKITEVAKEFPLLFLQKKLCIEFGINGLGQTLGEFFTNSSGHPAYCVPNVQRWRGKDRKVIKNEIEI
jgi:hypothetical protein